MINIFISYSHRNSYWLDKNDEFNLIPFLEDSLKWQKVKFWYDHDLRTLPGVEYEKMINQEIEKSQLAVLLLSRDFINSSFIMEKELPKIKERLDANKINIIPILVEPWTMPVKHPASWLIKTQIIPGMPTPLIDYTDSKRNFLRERNNILQSIERILQGISNISNANAAENKVVIEQPDNNDSDLPNYNNQYEPIKTVQEFDNSPYIVEEENKKTENTKQELSVITKSADNLNLDSVNELIKTEKCWGAIIDKKNKIKLFDDLGIFNDCSDSQIELFLPPLFIDFVDTTKVEINFSIVKSIEFLDEYHVDETFLSWRKSSEGRSKERYRKVVLELLHGGKTIYYQSFYEKNQKKEFIPLHYYFKKDGNLKSIRSNEIKHILFINKSNPPVNKGNKLNGVLTFADKNQIHFKTIYPERFDKFKSIQLIKDSPYEDDVIPQQISVQLVDIKNILIDSENIQFEKVDEDGRRYKLEYKKVEVCLKDENIQQYYINGNRTLDAPLKIKGMNSCFHISFESPGIKWMVDFNLIRKIEFENYSYIASNNNFTYAERKNVSTTKEKLNKIEINLKTTLNIQASDLALSSDGNFLVTSIGYGMFISGLMGHSGKIEVWDLEKNSCLINISDNIGILQSVKLSPDNKLISACAYEKGKELLIWDFQNGSIPEFLKTNGHNIKCIEFTPDGKYLLCSVYRTIQIWDIKKRMIIAELEGHKNKIHHIAIDNESKMAISTSDSSEVGIWDLNLFQNTRFINIGKKVGKVVFLNDSNTVGFAFDNIGSNHSSEIAIFDLKNDSVVKILSGRKGDSIYSLAYNEHTKLLVSGSGQSHQNAGGTLAIYHTGNSYELIDVKEFEYGSIWNIAFSKNGKVIASTHGEPEPIKGKVGRKSVKIWNVNVR